MCSLLLHSQKHPMDHGAVQSQILSPELSRRDIRSVVFHLLYAADAYDYHESLVTIIENFNHSFGLAIPFDGEIAQMINAILSERNKLDDLYQPLLDNWRLDRISVCTKLILRYAAWELMHTTIDRRIIINEAVELAKCFAEADAYRFINGILDKAAQDFPAATQDLQSS